MANNRIYPKTYSLIPGMTTTHHGTAEHIPNMVRIQTSYCDGGMNYFHGGMNSQGIRVSFTNVEAYDGYCVSEMMGAGVAFNVVESPRYNAKKVQKVHDAIAPHVDELANLFRTDKTALHARLVELTKGI